MVTKKAITLLALLLVACATLEKDEQGYSWVCDRAPMDPVIVSVGVDVYLNCGFEADAESCSVRRPGEGCFIYLPPDPSPWMEPHERKHCSGCRHPNWSN